MLDFIFELDKTLFIFINHLPHNSVSDLFFTFLSGIGTWGIIWFIIGTALFIWEEVEDKDKKGLTAIIIAVFISLVFVDGGLKNIVRRERPQFSVAETIVVSDNRDSYSFPSGHATLAFAGAYILSCTHKKWRQWYYLIAYLIAFSRIYLGKHYPSDVMIGAILGVLIGYYSIKLVSKITLKPTKIQL